jgi:hypothetical protein
VLLLLIRLGCTWLLFHRSSSVVPVVRRGPRKASVGGGALTANDVGLLLANDTCRHPAQWQFQAARRLRFDKLPSVTPAAHRAAQPEL